MAAPTHVQERTTAIGPDDKDAGWRLRLFDGFTVTRDGCPVALGLREQRLLALLALAGDRPRSYLSGVLWPESTERRAKGSLRVAVWNLERSVHGLVVADRTRLRLAADVTTDLAEFLACAEQVVHCSERGAQPPAGLLDGSPRALLAGDLLPGWYDDWVLAERSRIQQLQLRALEAATTQLTTCGRTGSALTTAMAARAMEPLRESAHRALISLHIADGNYHEALRVYHGFRILLARELGVAPSAHLDELVGPLLSAVPVRR